MKFKREKTIHIKLDAEKCRLIKQHLNIDLKIGLPALAEKLQDSLYQVAMLKKSGVKIDLEKMASEAKKLGADVVIESRGEKKDEDAKD